MNTLNKTSLLSLLLFAVILIFVPVAQASNPGVVNTRGVAVCWKTDDYRYANELYRAQTLWNQVAGKTRVQYYTTGCVANYIVRVNTNSTQTGILGTQYDGANGYMGLIILYKKAIDRYPECAKWTAAHEMGHALGLPHDKRYDTLMYGSCNKKYDAPTGKDINVFNSIWSKWPRSVETDAELSRSQGP